MYCDQTFFLRATRNRGAVESRRLQTRCSPHALDLALFCKLKLTLVNILPLDIELVVNSFVVWVGGEYLIPFNNALCALGDTWVDAYAVSRKNSGTQSSCLFDLWNANVLAGNVGNNLCPQRALGSAACKDELVWLITRSLFDQVNMAMDEKGGVLQNCAIEGVLIETLWIKLKVGERWACVGPVDVVHNVTEEAKHTVATCRNLSSVLVHDIVNVNAALFCLGLFCLAEAVAIPTHNQTRLECQSFVLSNLWNSVEVYTDTIVWVWSALIGVELVLPEATAKNTSLTRLATRIIAEMGCQIVKTYDCEDFEEVVAACPVPIVVAGGKKLAERDALHLAYDVIRKGARGVDMGRNIFQSTHPLQMAEAVRMIVHEGATDAQAWEFFEDATH